MVYVQATVHAVCLRIHSSIYDLHLIGLFGNAAQVKGPHPLVQREPAHSVFKPLCKIKCGLSTLPGALTDVHILQLNGLHIFHLCHHVLYRVGEALRSLSQVCSKDSVKYFGNFGRGHRHQL